MAEQRAISRTGAHSMAETLRDEEIVHYHTARDRRKRGQPRIGLNITPMIDVVFLLLVFFLVATNFKLGEELYRMDLPERGAAQASDPFELDEEPLRITVSSTGPMQQAYRLTIEGPYPQPGDFRDLRDFLSQRRIGAGGSELFAPDHPVIIEPTGQTRWEHVIGAFNAVVRAEFTNVTFGSPG